MGQRLTASFDELIRNRYGAKAADDPRFALRVEDLFASYYGLPSTSQPPQGSTATSVVLSRTDDGETLRQRGARGRNGQTRARAGQYVAQQSQCGCGTANGGEYVARRTPSAQPVVARQQSMSAAEMAFDECRVDLALLQNQPRYLVLGRQHVIAPHAKAVDVAGDELRQPGRVLRDDRALQLVGEGPVLEEVVRVLLPHEAHRRYVLFQHPRPVTADGLPRVKAALRCRCTWAWT